MPRRILTKAAVVAMRSIDGGGLVSSPKHARHLREVASRSPALIRITPAPSPVYFRAELTAAGRAFIGRSGPGRHRQPQEVI